MWNNHALWCVLAAVFASGLLLASCETEDGIPDRICPEPEFTGLDGCVEVRDEPPSAEVNFSGDVSEVGQGVPPEDVCNVYRGGAEVDPPTWFRLQGPAGEATVALRLREATPAIAVGDVLTVHYEDHGGGQGSAVTEDLIIAREKPDGSATVIAWLGRAAAVELLSPPAGFVFSRDRPACRRDSFCGELADHVVTVAGEGGEWDVPPGEFVDVEGWRIVSGGDQERIGEPTCADGGAPGASIAAVRLDSAAR